MTLLQTVQVCVKQARGDTLCDGARVRFVIFQKSRGRVLVRQASVERLQHKRMRSTGHGQRVNPLTASRVDDARRLPGRVSYRQVALALADGAEARCLIRTVVDPTASIQAFRLCILDWLSNAQCSPDILVLG